MRFYSIPGILCLLIAGLFIAFMSCASLSDLQSSLFGTNSTLSGTATSGWLYVGSPRFSPGAAYSPDLAVTSSGDAYVVYCDSTSSTRVMVKKFDGASWVNAGTGYISSLQADNTSIAISTADGTAVYVSFVDRGSSSSASSYSPICVQRFNGTNWTTVGSSWSAGVAGNVRIAVGSGNTPYVAYAESSTSRISAIRYTNNSWGYAGSQGFTPGQAFDGDLATDPAGTPYAVFTDGSASSRATVMKYNGTSWTNVGPTGGMTAGTAFDTTIAFNTSGVPYIAFVDGANSSRATVMSFNGASWSLVGTAGFSPGQAASTAIAVSPDGTPYVIFQDYGSSTNATVMRYNGTNWETVGQRGFSGTRVASPAIAIDGSGIPYVLFQEPLNSSRVSVMKFTN